MTNRLNIQSPSLGVAWIDCMSEVLRNGEWVSDESVRLRELRGVTVDIADISPTDPIICILADPARINLMRTKYARGADPDRHGVNYGSLLYDNGGADQIQCLVNRLQRKRETKSATVTFHPPGAGSLSCISMIDCKIRSDRLEMTTVYRSQNVYGSQPGNSLVMWDIATHIARACSVPIGVFRLFLLSAHIYEADIARAEECISISRESAERGFTKATRLDTLWRDMQAQT
jgi:thymidylate synthase